MAQLDWKAIAAGAAVAATIAVVGGTALDAVGASLPPLFLEAVALVLGGMAAARLAGRAGVGHGIAVGIVYIIASAAVQGWQEFNLASTLGPDAVESIDLLSLIVSDLVFLGSGALGGALARKGGIPARR